MKTFKEINKPLSKVSNKKKEKKGIAAIFASIHHTSEELKEINDKLNDIQLLKKK